MSRKFKKNKGQNVAEYAILIALVVGAIIAMQTFVQRTMQARVRDASEYLVAQTDFGNGGLYKTGQYVPYYLDSEYDTDRETEATRTVTGTSNFVFDDLTTTTRGQNGYTAQQLTGTSTIGEGIVFNRTP